jgi:hypothetical protein
MFLFAPRFRQLIVAVFRAAPHFSFNSFNSFNKNKKIKRAAKNFAVVKVSARSFSGNAFGSSDNRSFAFG